MHTYRFPSWYVSHCTAEWFNRTVRREHVVAIVRSQALSEHLCSRRARVLGVTLSYYTCRRRRSNEAACRSCATS